MGPVPVAANSAREAATAEAEVEAADPRLWNEGAISQSRMNMGWSWRFWPTPGRWIRGVMLWEVREERSPMPERRRSFGVSMAPAQRMVSCLEWSVGVAFSRGGGYGIADGAARRAYM